MKQGSVQLEKTSDQVKASVEIKRKGRSKVLSFDEQTLIIGSLDSAHIKLSEFGISPIHAVIEINLKSTIDDSEARIIDLASSSGVFVNGYKVISKRLFSGDVVEVGEAKFTFQFKTNDMLGDLSENSLLLIDHNEVTPIFEEKDSHLKTIEFVYSLNDVIIDVQHYKSEAEVCLPAVMNKGETGLIASRLDHQWLLHLTSEMTGFIYKKGLISHFNQFESDKPIDLQDHEFVKVQIGMISVFIRLTQNLPYLQKKIELDRDPTLRKNLTISTLITGLILFAVSLLPPPPPPPPCELMNCNPAKNEEKGIILKYKDVFGTDGFGSPKFNPLKKEGAKAAKKEGKIGDPHTKTPGLIANKTNQKSSTQPSTSNESGNIQKIRHATNQILKLIGSSNVKGGKEKYKGFYPNTGSGNSGLALTGTGPGGGGDADTLIGQSDKGKGPDTDGNDFKPNFEFFSKIPPGKAPLPPKGRPTGTTENIEEVTRPSIDMEEVEKAIRAHKFEFLYCYEKEINTGKPNLKGKVYARFFIDSEGRATKVSSITNTLNSAEASDCVLGVIKRIQFPKPKGNTAVEVKYPFKFSNGAQ